VCGFHTVIGKDDHTVIGKDDRSSMPPRPRHSPYDIPRFAAFGGIASIVEFALGKRRADRCSIPVGVAPRVRAQVIDVTMGEGPRSARGEWLLRVTCCLTGHLAAVSAAEGEAAEIAGKQT
jgi:hypothetical protein